VDGGGVMAWCPVGGNVTAGNLTVRDVTLNGGAGPAILIFQTFSLALENVTASATQGLGTMPIGGSWPMRAENCTFSGADAAVVLWQHIGSFRDLNVPQAGVDGVRARGGVVGFERTFVGRVSAGTTSIFRFVGDDDGGEWTVRTLLVDNEDFAGSPSEAVVSATAGTWHGGALILEDLNVSRVDAPASFVRLDGIGAAGNRQLGEVRAKGLRSYLGCQTGLSVGPMLNWQGTFDMSALAPMTAAPAAPLAPNPAAAMIRITPYAVRSL
jgi:hypothetical protein